MYRRRAKVGSMSKKENDKEIKTGERNDDEDKIGSQSYVLGLILSTPHVLTHLILTTTL